MDRKSKRNLAVDLVALAVYLVAANPAITGVPAHEWVGVGLLVAFLVHVAQHFDWAVETVRSLFDRPSASRVGHLVLDVLILVAFMVCTVSGLLVSGTVLQAFGLYADGYFFWDPLHAASAKALLALLVVHIAVHWRWIVRHVRGKASDRRGAPSKQSEQ